MKSVQSIESKLQALKNKLDFVLRERDMAVCNEDFIDKNRELQNIREQIKLLTWVLGELSNDQSYRIATCSRQYATT